MRGRPDLIAFAILLILALSGVLSPTEAVSGFGSPAVVAVAGIFALSAGLERAGVAGLISRPLRRLAGRSEGRLTILLMMASGLLAAVTNLAAVSVLLPVTTFIANRRRISPTVLLLPLAYAAMFGGKATMIGGPANLVMAEILDRRGVATLRLFDFLPLGLSMLVVGIAWMGTVGRRLLPAHPPEELLRATRRRGRLFKLYRLSERLFEARIPANSPLAGKAIAESEFGRTYGLTIVAVVRNSRQVLAPPKEFTLRPDDRLVIAGRLDELLQAEAFERIGIELSKAEDVALDSSDVGIIEAVVSPRSTLAGRTLRDVSFRDRYGLTALALWREGRPIRTHLASIPLQVGDGLLIQGQGKALQVLKDDPDFIVLDEEMPGAAREDRRIHALLAVGIMVALTLIGVHIAIAVGVAAGIMVLTGVLTVEEAYRAIDLRSIVLMGGMLSLALALEKTGAAATLAQPLLAVAGTSPRAAVAVFLAMGVVLGQFIPTMVQAALLTPLAINVAAGLGTSTVPLAMAIMAANGLAILTPFGNPVMLLVMSPGGYRLQDYTKSGLPLVAILIIVLLVVIPLAYPF